MSDAATAKEINSFKLHIIRDVHLTSIKLAIALMSDPFASFKVEMASNIIALYLINKKYHQLFQETDITRTYI